MAKYRCVGLLGLALWAGCGGDDGGGNEVSSGLPAEAKLSSLDTEDAQQLCMSMADSFNNMLSDSEMKKISCVVLAAPLVADLDGTIDDAVAKCKMLVSRCMSGEKISSAEPSFEVEEDFIDDARCEDTRPSETFQGCQASVGEFESCATGMLDALSTRFDVFDCETLREPEKLTMMDSSGLDLESQPKCEALYEKCPNIDFGTEDEEEDPEG